MDEAYERRNLHVIEVSTRAALHDARSQEVATGVRARAGRLLDGVRQRPVSEAVRRHVDVLKRELVDVREAPAPVKV